MNKSANLTLPTLPMRGLVIFPRMVLHFDVGRESSVAALKAALDGNRKIFLTAQNDIMVTEPSVDDLYKVGVVAEIRQILKTPDNITRVLVEGLYKAEFVSIEQTNPYFILGIKSLENEKVRKIPDAAMTAITRMLKETFAEFSEISPKMPSEIEQSVLSEEDPSKLFDIIVFNTILKVEDRQKLLEISSPYSRLEELILILKKEIQIISIERSIHIQVKEQIDKNQRDYYLREQMKIISRQLGDSESTIEENLAYVDEINETDMPEEVKEKLLKEAEKLFKLPPSSHDGAVIRSYLDACLELPWGVYTKDKLDINKAKNQLDKDHYGLTKVKDRILELLSVRALTPDIKGQIICLVGPPGVGKTSIGKSIAASLGRKYTRISLGGVRDEADIRGHRKTYIGAMPGRIAAAIKQAESMNPLILLDEIDKMGNDFKGDPSAAMLEVLDSEQNNSFRDHYLEIPLDLSQVLFVTTANTLDTIPVPLLDRMEVIEIGSYTREEKFNIAKKHLLTKQLKKHGLKQSVSKITDEVLYILIDNYTREAGVRKLERQIASLCRKAAKKIVSGELKKVIFTSENIEEYLGPKKYISEELSPTDEVGLVNGLAWTSVGGVMMPLEVLVLDGAGKTEFTGSLGDVMKESARIAVSVTRSLAKKYGIDDEFYKNKDIHIHAPEGAVPKDGPSAGIALTTCLISALSEIEIKRDVAMTGEITLRGKVLAIGGLREKTMAAYKAGVKTVIIPKENEPDLSEVDDIVKENVKFVIASNIEEVLDVALTRKPIQPKKRKTKISLGDKPIKLPSVESAKDKSSTDIIIN